jgi:hypothetical protein
VLGFRHPIASRFGAKPPNCGHGVIATPRGCRPTVMGLPTVAFVAVSITDTIPSPRLVT